MHYLGYVRKRTSEEYSVCNRSIYIPSSEGVSENRLKTSDPPPTGCDIRRPPLAHVNFNLRAFGFGSFGSKPNVDSAQRNAAHVLHPRFSDRTSISSVNWEDELDSSSIFRLLLSTWSSLVVPLVWFEASGTTVSRTMPRFRSSNRHILHRRILLFFCAEVDAIRVPESSLSSSPMVPT